MSRRRIIICICLVTIVSFTLQFRSFLETPNASNIGADDIVRQSPDMTKFHQYYPEGMENMILEIERLLQDSAEKVRTNSIDTNSSCLNKPRRRLLHLVTPQEIGYFEKVSEFIPSSDIILYDITDSASKGFIDRDIFIPVSNDCNLTEHKARLNLLNRTGCVEGVEVRRPVNIPWETLIRQENLSYLPKGNPGTLRHFIHVIPDAAVNEDGEVMVRDTKLVSERCETVRVKLDCFVPNATYDEVFVITQFWGFGFFHGAVEGLTKLSLYLRFLQDNPHIQIHVGGLHPYLALLNLKPERIVAGPVQAGLLYMPGGTPCFTLPYFTGQLLSWQLQRHIPNHSHDRDTVILIKRTKKRWFEHHDAIHTMIQGHTESFGLRVVVYKDTPLPPLVTAVNLFHRAVAVIAPHGAGLTNILFSQPGTLILEVLCHENDTSDKIQLCYQRMATVLGMRYYGLTVDDKCMTITADQIEKPFVQYMKVLGYAS